MDAVGVPPEGQQGSGCLAFLFLVFFLVSFRITNWLPFWHDVLLGRVESPGSY